MCVYMYVYTYLRLCATQKKGKMRKVEHAGGGQCYFHWLVREGLGNQVILSKNLKAVSGLAMGYVRKYLLLF